MSSTKIICKNLGILHIKAIHTPSGSSIYTDAPKDHDGNGEGFAPTDLLASSLGTCVITMMSIEAKRRGWDLGEIELHVNKIMTSKAPRKIESLLLEIFIPYKLDHSKFEVLKSAADECLVKINPEYSINIELNWQQGNI